MRRKIKQDLPCPGDIPQPVAESGLRRRHQENRSGHVIVDRLGIQDAQGWPSTEAGEEAVRVHGHAHSDWQRR
ncbi:MAG: hypothetical protein ACRC8G_09040 [Plesiomonas shigelloides]